MSQLCVQKMTGQCTVLLAAVAPNRSCFSMMYALSQSSHQSSDSLWPGWRQEGWKGHLPVHHYPALWDKNLRYNVWQKLKFKNLKILNFKNSCVDLIYICPAVSQQSVSSQSAVSQPSVSCKSVSSQSAVSQPSVSRQSVVSHSVSHHTVGA